MFNSGEPGLHWAVIAARLAERMPEHYTDATAEAISAQLREHAPSVNVKVPGGDPQGPAPGRPQGRDRPPRRLTPGPPVPPSTAAAGSGTPATGSGTATHPATQKTALTCTDADR